ncbi:MAG: hypothetical protein FWG67_07870, partial [Defluviitaleaceae bacterium]|nr:hypothetical protein [Defluviitaleaceae bacterium]
MSYNKKRANCCGNNNWLSQIPIKTVAKLYNYSESNVNLPKLRRYFLLILSMYVSNARINIPIAI